MSDAPEGDKNIAKPRDSSQGLSGDLLGDFLHQTPSKTKDGAALPLKYDLPETSADRLQPLQITNLGDPVSGRQPASDLQAHAAPPADNGSSIPLTALQGISERSLANPQGAVADAISIADKTSSPVADRMASPSVADSLPQAIEHIASVPTSSTAPLESLSPPVVPVDGRRADAQVSTDFVTRSPVIQTEQPQRTVEIRQSQSDSSIVSGPQSRSQIDGVAGSSPQPRQSGDVIVRPDPQRPQPIDTGVSSGTQGKHQIDYGANFGADGQKRQPLSELIPTAGRIDNTSGRVENPSVQTTKPDSSTAAVKSPAEIVPGVATSGAANIASIINAAGTKSITEASRSPAEPKPLTDTAASRAVKVDTESVSKPPVRDEIGSQTQTSGRNITTGATDSHPAKGATIDGKAPTVLDNHLNTEKQSAGGSSAAAATRPGTSAQGRLDNIPTRPDSSLSDTGRSGVGGSALTGPHTRNDMVDVSNRSELANKAGKLPVAAENVGIKPEPIPSPDGAQGKGAIGIVGRFDNSKPVSKTDVLDDKGKLVPAEGKGISGFAANVAQSIRDKFSPSEKSSNQREVPVKKSEAPSNMVPGNKAADTTSRKIPSKTSEGIADKTAGDKDKSNRAADGQDGNSGLGRFLSDFAKRALSGNLRPERDLPGSKTENLAEKVKPDPRDYLRNQKGDKSETLKLKNDQVELRQQERQAAQKSLEDAKTQKVKIADASPEDEKTVITTPGADPKEDSEEALSFEPSMVMPSDDEFELTESTTTADAELDEKLDKDATSDKTDEEKRQNQEKQRATYIVLEGDYLELVSTKLFANTSYVPLLKKLNPNLTIIRQYVGLYEIEVEMLRPGEEIFLPTKAEVQEFSRA